MPQKICSAPGCEEIALPGESRCAECLEEQKARRAAGKAKAKLSEDAIKGSELYRSRDWRKAAHAHLQANPLCVDCAELGLVVEAQEVDHIKPHRGDRKLFWDRNNWQSLCKSCHSRKTAREAWHGGVGQKP